MVTQTGSDFGDPNVLVSYSVYLVKVFQASAFTHADIQDRKLGYVSEPVNSSIDKLVFAEFFIGA